MASFRLMPSMDMMQTFSFDMLEFSRAQEAHLNIIQQRCAVGRFTYCPILRKKIILREVELPRIVLS